MKMPTLAADLFKLRGNMTALNIRVYQLEKRFEVFDGKRPPINDDNLTAFEAEMVAIIEHLVDYMAPGRPLHKVTHMEMLGRLRDMLKKAENKKFGCKTGEHSGPCECSKG